jgi:hypothetical protein
MPMLYTAANEDFLSIDKVVNKPAIEFLNFVNFYKRKCELDNERIQKGYRS